MYSKNVFSETDYNPKDDTNVSNTNDDGKKVKDENDSIHEIFFKSKPNKEKTSINKMKDTFLENGNEKTEQKGVLLDNCKTEFSTEVKGIAKCTSDAENTSKSSDNPLFEIKKYELNSSESKEEINEKSQLDHNEICIEDDTICGIGCFKPKWIQKYATPKVFLVLFSISGVIQGAYYSYFVSILTTLEKRYAFNTKTTGGIMLVEELTPLFLAILVGYIGGKTHRPRLVALGMFLCAVCCLLTAFPFALYGPAKHLSIQGIRNETSSEVCDELKTDDCDLDEKPSTMSVVGILIIAFFLKGFSVISYHVIGFSYMDDNAKKKNTSIYLAVVIALRYLGPLLGFLMSSVCLKFYENPFEDPGFGPEDPRWIGAWWMGFVLQGVLTLLFTFPFALFPRRLPSHKKPERKTSSAKEESLKEIFSGLVEALGRLRRNPIFVFLAINTVLTIFGHFGHSIMLPKYMENQFKLSAADASLFSGATSVTCMMVSTMFGGLLIWKFRPSAKMLLTGMIVCEICMCVGFLLLMIPRCQTIDMSSFGMNNEGLILNGQCNQNCDCTTTSFAPFCGQDGKTTYFTPCYAGCKQQLMSFISKEEKQVFGNCSCVTDESGLMTGKITEGFCADDGCWTQTLAYLCILLVLTTIRNTLTVGHTMILLRSVHPIDKSIALGTFEAFCCLFGFIPFPITYGSIVDSACLVWGKSCGQTGNCWFYDVDKYRYMLHGVSSFFCTLSVCCIITMYCFSARIRNLYEDEDDDDKKSVTIKLDNVSGPIAML